jgi:hypothetical protein
LAGDKTKKKYADSMPGVEKTKKIMHGFQARN